MHLQLVDGDNLLELLGDSGRPFPSATLRAVLRQLMDCCHVYMQSLVHPTEKQALQAASLSLYVSRMYTTAPASHSKS